MHPIAIDNIYMEKFVADIESIVRNHVYETCSDMVSDPSEINVDLGLFDHYGFTSLNMVLMMTSLCDETGVPLTHFTEKDIAHIKTPKDIIAVFEGAIAKDQTNAVS